MRATAQAQDYTHKNTCECDFLSRSFFMASIFFFASACLSSVTGWSRRKAKSTKHRLGSKTNKDHIHRQVSQIPKKTWNPRRTRREVKSRMRVCVSTKLLTMVPESAVSHSKQKQEEFHGSVLTFRCQCTKFRAVHLCCWLSSFQFSHLYMISCQWSSMFPSMLV